MKIKLNQVIDAIETANEAFTYFYNAETGETVYLQDELITEERDEELEELIENSPRGRFLRFPTKYDIHEALWRALLNRCRPVRPVRSWLTRFEEKARSAASRTEFITIILNSSGMIIRRRRIGRSPFAGAGTRKLNT